MAPAPGPPAVVRLVTPDVALLDAAVAGDAELGRALGCPVAEGWVVFGGALRATRDELAAHPGGARWGTRLFVLDGPRTLVGWGGFKGPPQDGAVELGYAVAPGWRGRGVATAAVTALLEEAFADSRVDAVLAHTIPDGAASARVLEKAGFADEGEVDGGGGEPVRRHRLRRGAVAGARHG